MNKQLELFLITACEFAGILDGSIFYTAKANAAFDMSERYASGVPRTPDAELDLKIEIQKTGRVVCSLHTSDYEYDLDRAEFSLVNATLENIEKWLVAANIDASEQAKAVWIVSPIEASKEEIAQGGKP